MENLDRRSFLAKTAAAVGALTVAGPVRAYAQNRASGASTTAEGYGPLTERGDLALPRGFQYRVISREGDRMSDGNLTPSRFDGMGAFRGPGGSTVLIRNHENRQSNVLPFPAFELPVVVPEDRRYDPAPQFNGGDTKLVVGGDRRVSESFAVLGGTTTNCAGGRTRWGSWLACEEIYEDGDRPHGYVFEIDARTDGPVEPVPIRGAGRFFHEAVAWLDGRLYLTEDREGVDVCLYRYIPDIPPRGAGDLARTGGTLQALKIAGEPGRRTSEAFPMGRPLPVEWVTIEEPEPEADVVREEGHSKGAARFSREEGIWAGGGRVYFDCTNGGAAGQGQIWELDPRAETIELIYESPGPADLQGPDNLVVGPTGDVFICEDSIDRNPFVRGLTPDGRIYPFARALANQSEFCGACFSPGGETLFVNQQGLPPSPDQPAVTYAIWGPFGRRSGG